LEIEVFEKEALFISISCINEFWDINQVHEEKFQEKYWHSDKICDQKYYFYWKCET
jgi:hypothetical protein